MQIESLKLDYYSGFLGEDEIRFYTNPKEIVFRKNIQEYRKGKFHEIQLQQGENNIYFFSLWAGYFNLLIRELIICKKDYQELPVFIKNWNECKGWRDIESNADVIYESELDWLIEVIPKINEKFSQSSKKSVWNYDCIFDLLKFLNFVKNSGWELRICEE